MPSPLEQELTQKIARGGESIDMLWKDPLPSYGGDESIASADPLTLLAVAAQGAFNPPPPPEVDPFEQVAQMMTPAYLREDYSGPQTGSKVGDALAGLGQVFQSGSGAEGILGGGGTALAQVAGDLPAAGMAMGTLGGVKARGANLRMLDAAQGLDAAGAHPMDIWQKTGWFKDVDGNWKFEISNDAMELTPRALDFGLFPNVAPMREMLREDSVLANYPELESVNASFGRMADPGMGKQISEGSYTPAWKTDFGGTIPARITAKGSNVDALLGTLTHELEHAVQNIEGWQGGGSPGNIKVLYHKAGVPMPYEKEPFRSGDVNFDPAYNIYAALLGEANARAASLRRPWTGAERSRQMIEDTRLLDPNASFLPGYFTQFDPSVPIEAQLIR